MNNYSAQIETITSNFLQAIKPLGADDLRWRPDAKSWSAVEILNHIIILNASYFPIFKELKEGTYRPPITGKLPFLTRFFSSFILKSVQPQEARKVKTMPIWVPPAEVDPTGIAERFAAHQGDLKKELIELDELIRPDVVIGSPANRFFVYSLDKAVEIILTHEERHLKQLRELIELLKNRD